MYIHESGYFSETVHGGMVSGRKELAFLTRLPYSTVHDLHDIDSCTLPVKDK